MKTAVLFLVFNRPDTTEKVFQAISKAKPPRLYVAADGPRANYEGDLENVNKVREISTLVDWTCEVKTLFRKENLGCKKAVSEAINWFFEQEEQGIILEDDCLPNQDFFRFCESLLDRYVNDQRVWVITGNNFQIGVQRGHASYYFSRYNHVWGWATWRRACANADMTIKFWPEWKKSKEWKNFWLEDEVRVYWMKIFDIFYLRKIDTWDYPWTACVWYYGGLTATPNVNLVSNIGFGQNATHTFSSDSPLSRINTLSLGEIRHPEEVVQNFRADRFVFDYTFNGRYLRFPYLLLNFPRRLVSFLKKNKF